MKKIKINNKIITGLILSSNILYGNVLLIDLNFGTQDNIRSYESSFPTTYSSINIKETKALYTKDFTRIFANVSNAGNINIGTSYSYSNWSEYSNWINSNPSIFTSNPTFVIIKKDIQNVDDSVSTYSSNSSSYNTVINYNYCEFTRYESSNLLINKLKIEKNPTLYSNLNNHIEVFTPEMIIKYKNINHEEGKNFLKSHLNIKTFIDFYKEDLNDNEIRKNFSKLITSVDISQWEYRNNISPSARNLLNFNTTIRKVIENLNKIKEDESEKTYMIEVLNIIKNLNLNYYNNLHSNSNLFYGNKVCLKSNENNNNILNELKNLSIPIRSDLVDFMNKYNAEKIVFNYKKEVLKHQLNTIRDFDFTLLAQDYGYGWGWRWDWWWDGWWWNSSYTSDKTQKKILTFIDKSKINFSTEGSFVSKILTPNNQIIEIVSKNYTKGNLFKMNLNLKEQDRTISIKSPSTIASEKSDEEAIVNQQMNEKAQEATDLVNAEVSDFKKLCIDIINLKFSKSYDAVAPSEEDAENQPNDDEWSWNTALNEYIVKKENDRRKLIVEEEEEKIDLSNDLIDGYNSEIDDLNDIIDGYNDDLEPYITRKNTQENILNNSSSTEEEIDAANLALNGDDDTLGILDQISAYQSLITEKENNIETEEDNIETESSNILTSEGIINENQPLTEEEEYEIITNTVNDEYEAFDASERSIVESCVNQPGSCPVD